MFRIHKGSTHHRGRVLEEWVFDAQSPLLTGAAVADLNGDGKQDIIFGTKAGAIHCVDEHAQEKWVYGSKQEMKKGEEYFFDIENLYAISATPIIEDINADGKKEIIFGSSDGIIHALNSEGKLLWKTDIGGSIKGMAIDDIDNDGFKEIIVASSANMIAILNNKGKKIAAFQTPSPCEAVPAILKGEKGKPTRIYFGLIDGTIYCIDTQEKQLWTYPTGDKISAKPAFFEKDGETLIAIGSWDGYMYVLSCDGALRWRYKTNGAIHSMAAIGDINNDGEMELVFGSCDNNVYALALSGEKIWSYQTGFWVMSTPIITDIDNDGENEVIIGSFDTNMYVLDGSGSYEFEYVPGLSSIIQQNGHYADVLSTDPGIRQGKRLWQYRTKGMVVGCNMIGDKHPHIIVNVKSGFINALEHKRK